MRAPNTQWIVKISLFFEVIDNAHVAGPPSLLKSFVFNKGVPLCPSLFQHYYYKGTQRQSLDADKGLRGVA